MSPARRASYEELAQEYYDPKRHPTCANFRVASRILLDRWLGRSSLCGTFLEVGPGRSLVAEWLAMKQESLDRLLLGDSSRSMLGYSVCRRDVGARLLLADARALPLPPSSILTLVSSLGDPYNSGAFWKEAARVLQVNGRLIFTTPSEEWARTFRRRECSPAFDTADFVIATGETVSVPSSIYPKSEQQQCIESAGLTVEEIADIPIDAIPEHERSPKLCIERGSDASIVTGYLARKLP